MAVAGLLPRYFLPLVFSIILPLAAEAQVNTWTGTAVLDGTNWQNSANWNPNTVPGPASQLLVPLAAFYPVINSPAAITSLTLDLGTTATIVSNMSITGAFTGSGLFNLNANTLTVGGVSTTTAFAGTVAGAGGALTKVGTGILTLSGTNTYSGGTTINGGTVSVGADTNLGLATGTLTFGGGTLQYTGGFTSARSVTLNAGGGTLDTNNNASTLSGNITGTGALTKVGAGTLTLLGMNSYSGGTTVSAGTLQGNTTSLQGAITNNAAVVFDQAIAGTYAGIMSGTGSLAKQGVGVLTVSGANTYSGATTVNAGTLQAGAANVLGTNSAVTVTGGATLNIAGFNQAVGSLAGAGAVTLGAGTLTAGADNSSTAYSGVMSGLNGALTKVGTGTLTLLGANSYSGGTTVSAGTLQGNTTSLQGAITNNAAVVFDQAGAGTYAGIMSGTGSLTKQNAGTLILSGANTYSGGTTVSAGTLQGNTMSLQGTITNNAAVVFDQAIAGTYAGIMSGTGSLTKQGAGTLTLSGANTYSGGTTVSAGTLQGNTTSLQGTITNNAAVVFDQAIAGTYAGIMSGTGSLTKQGAGTLTLSGANSYTGTTMVTAGTLAINGSTMSATIINNGGTLGGTGSITGAVTTMGGGMLAPGNSIGTLNVTGNVVFDANSIYQVEVDPAGNSDRLQITGSATLNGNGTVDVRAGSGAYQQNTQYSILTATGGVAGTFANVTSNLAFLTPSLSYTANSVLLSLTSNQATFSSVAQTANQRTVASALDAVKFSATGDFSTVINTLTGLSATQARTAFSTMSGEVHGTTPIIGLTNGTTFARTLSGRIGQAQPGAGPSSTGLAFSNLMLAAANTGTMSDMLPAAGVLPTSAKLDDDRGVWIRGYGVSGSLNGDGNAAGADYHLAGMAVGVDQLINNRLLLGAGAGYMRTSASLTGLSDNTTVQSYQAAAYGSYAEGPWMVKAVLRYAYNSYDTTRVITIGSLTRTATGDYGGHEGSGYAEAGYSVTRGDTTLQPAAAVQYTHLRQNGFTEQGAGSLNLNVDRSITESLRSLLGPRVSQVLDTEGDWVVTLEGRALWSHEWSDVNSSITTRFSGAPAGGNFMVSGVSVGRDGAVLGGGAMATFSSSFSAFTDYNAEVRHRQTEHQAVLGLRWSW